MLRSVLVASVATAMLAFAAPALAVNFTSSQITDPADGAQKIYNDDSPNTMHVAGTTTGGDSNADLVCFYGTQRSVLATNVTVTAGAFNTDVSAPDFESFTTSSPKRYCTLRAVPTTVTTIFPPNKPSTFAGPKVFFGRTQTTTIPSGPNMGTVTDFYFGLAQSQGFMDFYSLGGCGLDYSFIFDPLTLAESSSLFYCNAWTYDQDGCNTASATCTAATQSELRVDGKNAYAPSTAKYLYEIDGTHNSPLLPGLPPLTFARTIDPLNGNLHSTETDPIVKCSPTETAFHPASGDPMWSTDCTSFVSTEIKLDRVIDTDLNGRRARFVDTWTNTGSGSHDLEVLYDEEFHGASAVDPSPSFAYSWINGSAFSVQAPGDVIQGPASGPGTVYVDGNADGEDTFDFPQGAVTLSPAPTSIRWYSRGPTYAYGVFRFAQSIPAGASIVVTRTYIDGGSKESIASRASAEQDRLGNPTVSITSPANGSSTDNPAATVTGTASDPGGAVTSLKVNGDTVPVAADGTWSKALTLANGENTITAEATDAAGNKGSASVKVSYAPKPDKTPPVIGLIVAKIKLAALLAKGLPVTVSCSEPCTFTIVLTADSKVLKVVRAAKAVTIGKASGSLTAAGSKKVTVKLTKKAKKALKKVKKVVITVKTTAKDKAGNSATKTKKVTVKRR